MPQATPGWRARLDRNDLQEDRAPDAPLALFEQWFEQARNTGLLEPSGMTLATADAEGRPSARTVLLKGFDDTGFRFYSNYDSRKARDLAANPWAALVFWWDALERQVRIEGTVETLCAADSDAYFAQRPQGSQIGAHASPQSRVVAGRAQLEQCFSQARARFGDGPIPRPDNWGGYCLAPACIEFWQGRKNRMHDRLRYVRDGDAWRRERLAP